MPAGTVIANGEQVSANVPCSIEQFLRDQNLLPRSVVVEHNGHAVAPSQFAQYEVRDGDRLEIVRIVAGG
jgi:thiamine biosynthesis protein ThiS